MSQTNPWPLPEGVALEKDALYGFRKPEFQGDEGSVLPFSLVEHSASPDTVVIKATGKDTYVIHHHNPKTTDELGEVQGLLPSMFPSDDEIQQARQRRGGPMQQNLASAHHLENDYHEGLRPVQNNDTGLMAGQSSVPANSEVAPPPAPDTGLMAGLGAPPTPLAAGGSKGKAATGKKKATAQ